MTAAASFDKDSYQPGETMALAIKRQVVIKPATVTIQVEGHETMTVTGTVAQSPGITSISDPDRKWTLQSDDGETAIFVSVA